MYSYELLRTPRLAWGFSESKSPEIVEISGLQCGKQDLKSEKSVHTMPYRSCL